MGPVGKIGIGIGAAAGLYMAVDVARYVLGREHISVGGTDTGTLTGRAMSFRHVIGFGLRNIVHPHALLIGYQQQHHARERESELFFGGNGKGYDNGADAFRHTYGAALVSYHLVRDAHMSPDAAAQFTREAGIAHENDSQLTGKHADQSRRMDLHNNDVGISIGIEQAVQGLHPDGADQRIESAVLSAIARGETWVLDADKHVRPTTSADGNTSSER